MSRNLNKRKTAFVVKKMPMQLMEFPLNFLQSAQGARRRGLAFFEETNTEGHIKIIPTTTTFQ
jgi:hypothetical protein